MKHPRIIVTALSAIACFAQQSPPSNRPDSLRFAVIGDSGSGDREQYEVGQRLAEMRKTFPYDFVIMLGDNIYGSERARDFQKKFEQPYKALLDAGVKFYASLGNHDNQPQTNYKQFNMNGQRFYTFKPKQGIRFFALDSNYMDREQLIWLEKELANSGSEWKICYFHHPLYASGMHGSNMALRAVLEPIFVKYGVDVVFSGHEHFYQRIKPQHGINYFVSGSAGQLRRGDLDRRSNLTAKGFDSDYHFMLIEVAGDQMQFQAISRTGQTIDSGVIRRPQQSSQAATAAAGAVK